MKSARTEDVNQAPWPAFTEAEAAAVTRVILSNKVNYWTGQEGREFEREFAQWTGAKHAIALHNGTLALELACEALDIGPGDDVIVTPRSFVASASAPARYGARPIFADVDRDSQNITAASIERVLTPRTKAIVCVHLAGWPCEMTEIRALAADRGIAIIEDCAQAHGALYRGAMVGTFGDVAAWSFCQDKIMTTAGEGGMITTSDEALWRHIWELKDHGKSYDRMHATDHPPGFRWLIERFGTNARMLEVQAVVGRLQLKSMAQWTAQRAANATAILNCAATVPALRVPKVPSHIQHGWYRAYAFLRPERLATGWSRDRVVSEINARGVPCFQGSCSEIYRERAFVDAGFVPEQRLPIAYELGETALAFLVHPTLSRADIERTCAVIVDVMTVASR